MRDDDCEFVLLPCHRCGCQHAVKVKAGTTHVSVSPCITAPNRTNSDGEVVECVFKRDGKRWVRADGWRP